MHNYPQDYIYGIILTADVDKIDFSQVFPKESSQLRYSLDGTQFVIKWDEDHEPTFITDGTIVPAAILSHAECLALMATPEWSEEPIE
jgi:hypothetical protein